VAFAREKRACCGGRAFPRCRFDASSASGIAIAVHLRASIANFDGAILTSNAFGGAHAAMLLTHD